MASMVEGASASAVAWPGLESTAARTSERWDVAYSSKTGKIKAHGNEVLLLMK